MPHMLKSHIKDAEAADKTEGSCYMPHVISQDSQKRRIWTWSKGNKSGTMLHFSVLWKNSEKQSTEGTVKYSMAQLKSGQSNILSQRVTKDLCLGEDSG